MDDTSVLLCVTLSLMSALLPRDDKFAMNCEAVCVSIAAFLLFLEAFCELRAKVAEKGAAPSVWGLIRNPVEECLDVIPTEATSGSCDLLPEN
jgi:hypothetical protein